MAQKEEKKGSNKTLLVIGIIVAVFIVGFILLFGLIFVLAFIGALSSSEGSGSGNVAIIHVDGVILTESASDLFGNSGETSSSRIVEELKQAKNDDSIKAVLIEINSPGGSGVASGEIADAIRDLGKPSVSYIREVGASGAYWVASSTDYIFANKMSTVGSIGVIASYLDFSKFIERYNISNQRLVAGNSKDFGDPFRKPTQEELDRFQIQLDDLHTIFIEEVARGRDLEVSYVRSLADGFIFTGYDAVDKGLIDEIGGKDQAVAYLEEEIGEPVTLVEYRRSAGFFDLIGGYTASQLYSLGRGIGEGIGVKMTQGTRIIT